MIFLMEEKTGMETINKIVSLENDVLVAVEGGRAAVPLRKIDAVMIKSLYEMSDASHKVKLDRMSFMQIMEIYMTAMAMGLVEVLKKEVLKKEAPAKDRKTWH